ncbi:hypothetical protein [Streptomyces sp. NPDC004533]|uniref:hypothetical protein n=1 Tax=Streptomyces sp. NPDC004533 TaxID=3154278 RepID=UPI0033A17C25
MANRSGTQNLGKHARCYYWGNAVGFTLRLTLCRLLGRELRRVRGGKSMTSGNAGGAALSQWMADNCKWLDRAQRTTHQQGDGPGQPALAVVGGQPWVDACCEPCRRS